MRKAHPVDLCDPHPRGSSGLGHPKALAPQSAWVVALPSGEHRPCMAVGQDVPQGPLLVGMRCVGVCSPGASGRLLLPKREVGDGHVRSPEGEEGCPWRGAPGCWRPGALTPWNHSSLLLCVWGTPTCHTPPRADWRVPLNPWGHPHSEAGRGQGLVLDLVDWPWANTKLTAFTMVPF